MDTILSGSRIDSRDTALKAESPYHDPAAYESVITSLFTPWIVTSIPDSAWQTLQEKLGRIVRDMLSGKKERNKWQEKV
jgi:hypothetical protein